MTQPPDPSLFPVVQQEPVFQYPFDQTNPQLWQAQNPDVGQSILRLQGLVYQNWSRLQWYDAYYEGEQPLSFMSAAMAEEARLLMRAVVLNWPRIVVDSYLARMKVEGFRYAGDEDTDDTIWAVWQANNLDKLFRQALLEMLALGQSFVVVGAADEPGGDPIVTVESPFQMAAIRDPRTRKVTQAVKLWTDLQHNRFSTLYEPNRTVTCRADGQHWVPIEVDDHGLGVVPVVPLVNRGRILRPNGVSQFHDVIPIVDAAIKAATDMMSAAEHHAAPRRWIFGLKKEDFKDQNGIKISPFSMVMGRVWASEAKRTEVEAGQFPESSLSNFHDTIKLLAQLASQVSSLSANTLAFNTVNPASAESLRALDAQLEMICAGKIVDTGEDAEDVVRLFLRFRDGVWDPKANSLESVWADPGITTSAQKADAAVKLVGSGIVPVEQAREDLGYTATQRARMAAMDERAKAEAVALAANQAPNLGQAQAIAMSTGAKPPPVAPAAPPPA